MTRDRGTGDEPFTVILVAAAIVVVVGPAMFWNSLVSWLITHRVLAPPSDHLLVVAPGTGGAGLDARRVAILIVLVLATAAASWAARSRTNQE